MKTGDLLQLIDSGARLYEDKYTNAYSSFHNEKYRYSVWINDHLGLVLDMTTHNTSSEHDCWIGHSWIKVLCPTGIGWIRDDTVTTKVIT